MIAQTILGWLSRKIMDEFTESAARQYLRRCLDERQSSGLREALGDNYEARFEVFLPFIEPDRFQSIQFLGNGANGSVLSAVWDRPADIEPWIPRTVSVVLKHPREDLSEIDARNRFLKEVCIQHQE